jgi:sterol desaturase/sphingolipid hydroxylase (fatty acid hydroxylase superfamily)
MLTYVVYGLTPVIVALSVENSSIGLLNRPWLPFAAQCLLAVLLLDLVKYAVHFSFHSFSILWRVHQVHHSDPEFDLSTTLRFHPIEVLAGRGVYLIAIAILAPPAIAVVGVELSRAFLGFFAHANAALPKWLEKPARALIITPDLHRIHHSEEEREQGKNFGDTFSFWDRLFHTYLSEPSAGHAAMKTGVRGLPKERSRALPFMLALPFLPQRKYEESLSATADGVAGD